MIQAQNNPEKGVVFVSTCAKDAIEYYGLGFLFTTEGDSVVRKLDDKAAIAAVKVFVGSSHRGCRHQYPAIKELIGCSRSKPEVVSVTVQLLLAKFTATLSNPRFMQNYDALSFALELLDECPVSRKLTETVVKTAAFAGFIGRFPELPWRLLNRNPSPEEVVLLVSAYVNDKGFSSADTEKKLERMALSYLSTDAAEAQVARIRAHQEESANYID